jgi:UDP-arabinose 4-epimerase
VRVLVVGGAGYIGSHTCKLLSRQNITPVTLDNLSEGHEWAVKWGPFYKADISDTKKLEQILADEKIDGVFHFAAFASVGESVAKPLKYYQNNVMGLLSLLNAMKNKKVRKIVFSSTCATYGLPKEIPIIETCPQAPINPYGKSKYMAEGILQDFVKAHKFSVTALRYFNAAGADLDSEIGEDHNPETHLIPLVLKAIHDPDFYLTVYGQDYPTPDGTCVRDYIHVTDLAEAHILALKKMDEPCFQFFNLGTGKGFSVKEIISTAEKVTGQKVKIKMGDRRQGDPPILIAKIERAQAELKWQPQLSDLSAILKSANSWYLKRKI